MRIMCTRCGREISPMQIECYCEPCLMASESDESAPSASANIDYTAALEEELMDFFGTGPLDIIKNLNLSKLATRLNSAVKALQNFA